MQEVFKFKDIIVLSDKNVSRIGGATIDFEDGSRVNLDEMVILNKGPGEIKFKYISASFEHKNDSFEEILLKTECSEIVIDGSNFFLEVIESNDPPRLKLYDTTRYIDNTEIYETERGIAIKRPQNNENVISDSSIFVNGRRLKEEKPVEGKIEIYIKKLSFVELNTSGKQNISFGVPIDAIHANLQGAGNIKFKHASNCNVKIKGSHSFEIGEITNKADLLNQGSGDIKVESGNIAELTANISGSGNIVINSNVTKGLLLLLGSGNIYVQKIMEESIEKHGGSGDITVASRG